MNNTEDIKELKDIKHPKKRLFLETYPKLLRTVKTAEAIGVNESTVYRWLEADKLFQQALQALKKRIDTDRLEEVEAEIHKRALEGLSKQSDILLIFEAKSLDPGKYREKPAMIPISGDIIVRHMIPRPPGVEVKQIKEGGRDGYREEESVTEGEDKALQG